MSLRRRFIQSRKFLLAVIVLGSLVCLISTRVILSTSNVHEEDLVDKRNFVEFQFHSDNSERELALIHTASRKDSTQFDKLNTDFKRKETESHKGKGSSIVKPTKTSTSKSTKHISSDYSAYLTDSDVSDLQNEYVNKHKYEFSLNNVDACKGEVLVIALVHSAPRKTQERTSIRKTWGSVQYYLGAFITPMFLVGQDQNGNKEVQEQLETESKYFKDMVQGNFLDTYRNLTYKNIMGLHWVQKYCNNTKFVMKTDDDTMVDVYHLVEFLMQKSPDGNLVNFLYCSVFKKQGPLRRNDSKWYVSTEEYPYSKYPDYCEGFAYIMSMDVSRQLYEASGFVKTFWIDDVYVTGFLALKAGILHKTMLEGHAFSLMETENMLANVKSSIFLLAKYSNLLKNWDLAWKQIRTVNKIFN